MKKIALISTLLLSVTLITSCNSKEVIDYMNKDEMLSKYDEIYKFTQNDSKNNNIFEYVNYFCEEHELNSDKEKVDRITKIQVDYKNNSIYTYQSIYNHKNKKFFETINYEFIKDDTYYYYRTLGTDEKYTYFTLSTLKGQEFTDSLFGSDFTFNPYADCVDRINSYSSKEDQARNIKNLNNTLKDDDYITKYDIKGYNKSENTFQLDYSYTIDDETKEYNLPIDHYVTFTNNYVSEYYFKNYDGSEYLNKYSYDNKDFITPNITDNEYTVLDPMIVNIPRINMMIGY